MARLIIVASARHDLSDIFDYIARDKPIAAANWVDKIQERCKLIATMPEFGEKRPEYGSEIRSSTVGRYVIFYRPIKDGIDVCESSREIVTFVRSRSKQSKGSCDTALNEASNVKTTEIVSSQPALPKKEGSSWNLVGRGCTSAKVF